MPDPGSSQPALTVGSLIGLRLGETATQPVQEVIRLAQTPIVPPPSGQQEGPWIALDGELSREQPRPVFRDDGVESLTFNNPFGQNVERVWYDGKIVFALDVGGIEVDEARVKVAQEFEIVYTVELDSQGKLARPPEVVNDQYNIYDSVPGQDTYSPIWQFNYVVVPRDYRPNTLRSEADCRASGYPIIHSHVFEN
jgi:hypothetical protein